VRHPDEQAPHQGLRQHAAHDRCRDLLAIRTYLATAARQGISALDALTAAAEGGRWIPETALTATSTQPLRETGYPPHIANYRTPIQLRDMFMRKRVWAKESSSSQLGSTFYAGALHPFCPHLY